MGNPRPNLKNLRNFNIDRVLASSLSFIVIPAGALGIPTSALLDVTPIVSVNVGVVMNYARLLPLGICSHLFNAHSLSKNFNIPSGVFDYLLSPELFKGEFQFIW
jgi:hypothetical protein